MTEIHAAVTAQLPSVGLRDCATPRSMAQRLVVRLGWLVIAVAVACWIVRLSVRDEWPMLAPIYYALQPVGIAIACLGVFVVAWRARRPVLLGISFSLALSSGAHWWITSFRIGSPPADAATGESIRVLLWNVTGQRFADAALQRRILDQSPDVIVLVEAYTNLASQEAARAVGYTVDYSPGTPSLLLLVRGEVTGSRSWITPDGARLRESHVVVRNQRLRVISVDVPSNPLLSRRKPLAQIASAAAERVSCEPTLILGDFNTPPDSVFFIPIRAIAASAWESAGSGYACTWPSVIPVLAIDQIWATGEIHAIHCEMHTSRLSDHRMVVADFVSKKPL